MVLPGLLTVAGSAHAHSAGVVADEGASEWREFQSRFCTVEGRVIDTGNGGVSHTEGQGVSLLFAEHFDDRAAFERILQWTNKTLGIRPDALHAWRYIPGNGGSVPDPNNATDGDILIACALARAGARWGRPDYTRQATAISRSILANLVVHDARRTLLLPAIEGFVKSDVTVINPSYYNFSALDELAALAPSPVWQDVERDGLQLMADGRFGNWSLPPDWLDVSRENGTLRPAEGKPPRFSFDAVRVPLNLAWARLSPRGVMESILAFWESKVGRSAAWVDLDTGAVAPYPATGGMRAVRQISAATDGASGAQVGAGGAAIPRVADAQDYYSASLIMLTRLAWSESMTAEPASPPLPVS